VLSTDLHDLLCSNTGVAPTRPTMASCVASTRPVGVFCVFDVMYMVCTINVKGREKT